MIARTFKNIITFLRRQVISAFTDKVTEMFVASMVTFFASLIEIQGYLLNPEKISQNVKHVIDLFSEIINPISLAVWTLSILLGIMHIVESKRNNRQKPSNP